MSSKPMSTPAVGNVSSESYQHFSLSLNKFSLDKNILSQFPKGTGILSASALQTSAWNTTVKLQVQYLNSATAWFFLKVASNQDGDILINGEYNAMSELFKWAPDLVPRPHSKGTYELDKGRISFLLSEYIPMSDEMPDPRQLCEKLAKLHEDSVSPTGQFGFHTTTCQGHVAQFVGWESNWRVFFTKLLQHVIKLDFETNGAWDELDHLERRFISYVIPRLLDALCTNGNSIKPSLIHADLWEGNAGMSVEGGKVYIFDSAAFYGHNEMETGNWRCYYNKIASPVYISTYLRFNPPSEPESEWEDRNRLYSVYFNIIYSVNHASEGRAVRQL